MEELETSTPRTAPGANLDALLAAQTPSLARRLLPWLLVLLLLAGGVAGAAVYATIERPTAVDVVEVRSGEVERTVASVAAGRVASRKRARIASDVIGRVVAIHARKGDRVEAGQLLVELDARDATAQLDMARSSRDAALHSIVEASSRLDWARADLKRKKGMGPDVISPDLVEHAETEVTALEAQLESLRSRATEQEARIKAQEALLEKHRIRAPFAGVISELWVELGEVTTTSGMGTAKSEIGGGSKLFEVIDPDDLYVTAPIDEVDLARVTTGLAARVTLDPYPKEPFLGTVTRIAPYVLDVEDQNRTVEIEVSIPSSLHERKLKPGISADVEVIVERKASVPRLPAHLLVDGRRALTVEEGPRVGELRARERDVTVGIENWRFAEVDLPLGTRVVAGGDARPKPGQLVTVRKTLDPESR